MSYDVEIIWPQMQNADVRTRGGASSAADLALIAAMCTEMTHLQDFQVKLYEYGWHPAWFAWAYGIVGWCFGIFSRLMGPETILKTGVWVEPKAMHHYSELLGTIPWDDDTRAIVEKNQADEYGHVERWKSMPGGGARDVSRAFPLRFHFIEGCSNMDALFGRRFSGGVSTWFGHISALIRKEAVCTEARGLRFSSRSCWRRFR